VPGKSQPEQRSVTRKPPDRQRLARLRTIDLTTYGRRSGSPRRIEIWWFHIDDRFIITGTPGRRDWLANVTARPEVIIHADGLDLRANVRVITDPESRRRVFTDPEVSWYRTQSELDRLVAEAPMIEVLF